MQTYPAEILDTASTYSEINQKSYLTIELSDAALTAEGGNFSFIHAELTEEMEDTEDALPALIDQLANRGWAFSSTPTDECGPVELVRL